MILLRIISPNHNTSPLGSDDAWVGTVGAVKNMTSLIGIGVLKMTHQVYTVVDFLGPLGGLESRLAQRKPRPIKPYWASLVDFIIHPFISENLDIQLRIYLSHSVIQHGQQFLLPYSSLG